MTDSLQYYYTASQARELDRLAITQHLIPGFDLMRRAGQAAFTALRAQWPDVQELIIFCGTGNNGGDGLIIARLAVEQGLKATVYIFGNGAALKGDALQALEYARQTNVPIHFAIEPPTLPIASANVILVDALLGTGLAGDVRAPTRQAIEAINRSGLPVLAIDIPSGLCSDTGAVLGACVKATLTITFIGRKVGLVTGEGPRLCGKVLFADLDVPPAVYRQVKGIAIET